jgi:hypothetical protein
MIMMLTGRLAQLGEGPIWQHSLVRKSMSVIEAVMGETLVAASRELGTLSCCVGASRFKTTGSRVRVKVPNGLSALVPKSVTVLARSSNKASPLTEAVRLCRSNGGSGVTVQSG